jgi:DNA-binding response OmpR family regulator
MRILLVDDHVDTLTVTARLLRASGHQVSIASSLREAQRVCDEHEFDVLVSDILLPDGSACSWVESMTRDSDRKVAAVALTGLGYASDVQATRDAGFAEHLTKPVTVQELLAAIDRVAKRRELEKPCETNGHPRS